MKEFLLRMNGWMDDGWMDGSMGASEASAEK